jgi:tetratricopeptide (TPR) repeat protein
MSVAGFQYSPALQAKPDTSDFDPFTADIYPEQVKQTLTPIITEPYDVEVNASSVIINFHQIILTTDNYLKNKLFSIASNIVSHKLDPEVIITTWKDLDSNYVYKAALVTDDLIKYQKGLINYTTLFSKMKIAKSQIERQIDTVETAVEKTKLQISPSDSLARQIQKPDLKPKLPPETFYTPILKPLIKNDFTVDAKENYVIITIYSMPDSENYQVKDQAYDIIRRIIGVNPSLNKIEINWQPEEKGYGKTASLAGIYIKDYFRKKMKPNEVKEVIMLTSIEPQSRALNNVPEVAKMDIPVENLRKAMKLREAANIYRENKKYDSALRTYRQAIKINPNDYLSYYWMGEIFIATDDIDKARESLTKSVGLNPGFRKADETLAKIQHK